MQIHRCHVGAGPAGSRVIVIVVVPELPASTSMKLELGEIPKSDAIGETVTSIVVVCRSEPLVAVIVTV